MSFYILYIHLTTNLPNTFIEKMIQLVANVNSFAVNSLQFTTYSIHLTANFAKHTLCVKWDLE